MHIFLTILGIISNQPSEATLLKLLLKAESQHTIVSGLITKDQEKLQDQKIKVFQDF